jgi:hypothetical protein
MVSGKTRAANDITVGEAETLHDLGMKIKADCKGNEFAIWMYLLSLPRRQQEQLAKIWSVTTCGEVAKIIAMPEAPHA